MGHDDALSRFDAETTPAIQLEASISLIKEKRLHKVVKEPAFERGFGRLLESVVRADQEQDRLIALAALGRLAAVVKSLSTEITERLGGSLGDPLPPLQTMNDPDDRYYAAKVWRYGTADWMVEYLAEAAVDEESAETVREECLTGLLTRTPTFDAALAALRAPVRRLRFNTVKPGDSIGRRLRKVLDKFEKAAADAKAEPTSEAGKELAALVSDAFRSNQLPESEDVRQLVAEEAIQVIDRIVKARFSLATEVSTYAVLEIVRGWFRAAEWADFTNGSPSARVVTTDLSEGLRILIRMGLTDDELYRRLVIATGSEERARESAVAIASTVTGLNEDVRRWVSGKPGRRESLLARESQELAADDILGELLLELRSLSIHCSGARQDVLPEIQVVAPRLANSVSRLLGTADSAAGKMELLAARRSLRTRGEIDAIVEYSPLEHEMVGGFKPGVRYVRLLTQIVESMSRPDVPRVIRKALVEPIERNEQ